jgi:hypothetical protein
MTMFQKIYKWITKCGAKNECFQSIALKDIKNGCNLETLQKKAPWSTELSVETDWAVEREVQVSSRLSIPLRQRKANHRSTNQSLLQRMQRPKNTPMPSAATARPEVPQPLWGTRSKAPKIIPGKIQAGISDTTSLSRRPSGPTAQARSPGTKASPSLFGNELFMPLAGHYASAYVYCECWFWYIILLFKFYS